MQVSTLLSIKTGACPEDCAYCPQSIRYRHRPRTRDADGASTTCRARAQAARDAGATRFCMGAAYRSPEAAAARRQIAAMVREVRALGLETCATLGMLTPEQARELKDAGLDYYNHNLDTSPSTTAKIITTRTYQDRLDTLAAVRDAGLKVCCGGILGMGETERRPRQAAAHARDAAAAPGERADQPAGAGARHAARRHCATSIRFDFVRAIAVARVLMPKAHVRLSAGRTDMSDELQALCFLAGRELDFLRREAADDRQSRRGA